MVDGIKGALKTAFDFALERTSAAIDAGLSKSPWVLGFNNAAQGLLNTNPLAANNQQYTAALSAPKNA